ncbi:MAG: SGNH/GDSL hydrolase family protein [Gammaproteobacteria bacterium]
MTTLPGRIRSALANLAIASASLALALVAAEFVFRWVNSDEVFMLPRFITGAQYGSYQIRSNVPGANYVHTTPDGRWEYRINARGQRDDREYEYAKPAGVVRVLALGDSFTLGFEVGQAESYPAILARALARRGQNVEVINAGVSGFSNAEALVYLREEGLRYSPDFVVLGFFVNDPTDNVRAGLYRMDDGRLVEHSRKYLPAIGIRDLLNSFALYRWLSEHSYIHNYLNAKATVFVRDWLAARNARAASEAEQLEPGEDYARDLTRALIAEIGASARAAGARFILMNIPSPSLESNLPISPGEMAGFADDYLDMRALLQEYAGLAALYRPHGFEHWTEFSHLLAGLALARIVHGPDGTPPARIDLTEPRSD